jgi:type VI secretion system secreted protein VgrG
MRETLSATGNFRSIGAGHVFNLKKAYRDDLNRSWVVVSASFSAAQRDQGVDYSISFTAIPSGRICHPLPRTPRPSLNLQTAYVVGPPGDVIYMDEYGRAKVQFHWDLDHDYEPDSSCWIRVAQPYAGIDEKTGDKHGFQWHPLIGDEVVVDFLEGDPDNPLIIGSVYNYINMQPIKPDQLIRSVILSPYQHSLAFDDKEKYIQLNTPYPHTLRMDDPGKYTHLTTQYQNALRLQDPHKKYDNIPSVTLETGGAEVIKMEDRETSYGNNIKVSTADGHSLHFAEGSAAQGITATTKNANKAVLDDQKKNITIQTTNGHRVLMDDANETIVVTSKDNHRIEINDRSKYIAVADSSGQHRFTIDIAGKQLTIATDTGSIAILAPEGQVKIDAKAVAVKAETSMTIDCNNMTTKAESKINVQAPDIKTNGTNIEEMATTIKNEGQQITIKGTQVTSEASAVNILKGSLVKIN